MSADMREPPDTAAEAPPPVSHERLVDEVRRQRARIILTEGLLKAQERRIDVLETAFLKYVKEKEGAAVVPQGPRVATDAELVGRYGDPVVGNKDPKAWTSGGGERQVGKHFSETSPEYLDEVAALQDWKSEKEAADPDPEKSKWAPKSRQLAAVARGWAQRLRAGWKPPAPPAAAPEAKASAPGLVDEEDE